MTRPSEQLRFCPVCARRTELPNCSHDGSPTVRRIAQGRDPRAYRPGEMVGERYRIKGILGRGGSATVYEVEQIGTGQILALKMRAADPEHVSDRAVVRFFREARIMAQLQHPNTVRVYDVGQDHRGPLFIAMERLAGPTLATILEGAWSRRQPLGERAALRIGVPLLRSLSEAHELGLVHRDVKPSNVALVRVPDDEPVVKLLDFGLARADGSSLTVAGALIGTAAYMSPEQCLARPIGPPSDLYSLGVVLFECIAGRRPFESDDATELMRRHAHEAPPSLRTATEGQVSDETVAAIQRAMAKKPEHRYANAREMRLSLEGALARAGPGQPLPCGDDGEEELVPEPTTMVSSLEAATVFVAPLEDTDAEATRAGLAALGGAHTLVVEPLGDAPVPMAPAAEPPRAARRPGPPQKVGGKRFSIGVIAGAVAACFVLCLAAVLVLLWSGPVTRSSGGTAANAAPSPDPAGQQGRPGGAGSDPRRPGQADEGGGDPDRELEARQAKASVAAEMATSAPTLQMRLDYAREASRLDPESIAYKKRLKRLEAEVAAKTRKRAASRAKTRRTKRRSPRRSKSPPQPLEGAFLD